MMKLSTAGGKLAVADYFEPYDTCRESDTDIDLGSGGAMLLPDMTDASGTVRHLLVGAGKDGHIYVGDRENLGKFNPDAATAICIRTCRTHWRMARGRRRHISTALCITQARMDTLKAFPITQAKLATTPSSQSAVVFPYPGSTPSISANGTQNAIVWALESPSGGPGVLHAYDATSLSNELYNSNQAANGRDGFTGNKFITPVIVNGKVFVGTPTGVANLACCPEDGLDCRLC